MIDIGEGYMQLFSTRIHFLGFVQLGICWEQDFPRIGGFHLDSDGSTIVADNVRLRLKMVIFQEHPAMFICSPF